MSRNATTSDVFGAVGETPRRRILELLAGGERSVGQIADALNLRQPQTSKHLHVLKDVGLVSVRSEAQQRLYRLNPDGIRQIFEWARTFERFWTESLDRLEKLLEDLQRKDTDD